MRTTAEAVGVALPSLFGRYPSPPDWHGERKPSAGAARILKANYALMIGTPAQKRLDQKLAWDGRLVT